MNKPDTWDNCASEYDTVAVKVTGPCISKLLEQVSIFPVTSFSRTIKVIDLAGGPGILGTLIGEAYSQAGHLEKVTFLSTDFSPIMVEKAKHRFASHNWPTSQFSASTFDATNLVTVPSNHYSHAFCTFGIMMIPDASKVLNEMFRVLEPSGVIGLTTWHKVGWMPIVSECLARVKISSTKQDNAALCAPLTGGWSDTSYVQKMLEDAHFQNVQVNIFESRWSFTNQDECVKQLTQSQWIRPILKNFILTDELQDKYNQMMPQVLLDIVNKESDQPFDLPMIAIIAHGQKSVE